ncbi:hypothetical protein ILYODFUR_009379 [Ilyodon furcidens]|uniref:Uncharacterized protein n=1 Tax=Ilyodon furcidens TaxID=33524 RepID=A0ABV0UET5_9TELE
MSPPQMTVSNWWSLGLSSSATSVAFVTHHPLPFCLLEIAKNLIYGTIFKDQNPVMLERALGRQLYTNSQQQEVSILQGRLLWVQFSVCFCYFFSLPTRTQAGDSV